MKKRRKRPLPKIVLAPNEILNTICEPVEDGEDVSQIVQDMMYILTNSKTGVGLSANQAGYNKRVILVKIDNFEYIAMINPVYTHEKPTAVQSEGCLSYPGKFVDVERYRCIGVKYLNAKMESKVLPFFEFEARIIQHEIDHLNGKCVVGM